MSCVQLCLTLGPRGLWPTRPLCPRNFPGRNTGASCHSLLQGIFPIQGLKLHLLHLPAEARIWQADSLSLCNLGSPCTLCHYTTVIDFPGSSDGKESTCNTGDPGSIPGLRRSPEKETATHSSILTLRFLWTEERVGYDRATNTFTLYYKLFLQ